jgi:hypothetical protein
MTALAWLVRHSCSTASGSPPFSGRCAPASSRTSKAPPIARSRTILRKIQTALNNKRPRGHSGPLSRLLLRRARRWRHRAAANAPRRDGDGMDRRPQHLRSHHRHGRGDPARRGGHADRSPSRRFLLLLVPPLPAHGGGAVAGAYAASHRHGAQRDDHAPRAFPGAPADALLHDCTKHQNKNFAVWFPFYDVLFGTAYRPKPGEFPETGVAGVEVSNLSSAFMLPFERWWQMARDVRRQRLS